MMITKRNFCFLCLMFMVLFNFHLSSRSTKTTANTLSAKSAELNNTQEENKARENSESKTNLEALAKEQEETAAKEENAAKEEAVALAKALAKEAERVSARAKAVAQEEKLKKEKVEKIKAEESAKLRTEEESRNKEESKAREEEKNFAKAAAKLQTESKTLAKEKSKTHSKNQNKDDKEKKKKKFQAKLDDAIKKRLSEMPLCKGNIGANGTDGPNGTNIIGGTNVFEGKINATDAVGMVGFTNYSVVKPPYKVKRCDQILLLPGKKLDMKDYCIKEDAFMTMSIYMVNFFLKKDPNKLLESFPMDKITAIPSQLPGAPGCTMWMTQQRSFPFCYESQEILEQVIQAYYDFLNCRKGPQGPRVAGALLKACDISKLDLSENGPFGAQGPAYRQIIEAMNPTKKKKLINLDDINPYYIYDNKVEVPGSFLNKINTRLNPFGRSPGNIPNSQIGF